MELPEEAIAAAAYVVFDSRLPPNTSPADKVRHWILEGSRCREIAFEALAAAAPFLIKR